jgi:hypothetical protein
MHTISSGPFIAPNKDRKSRRIIKSHGVMDFIDLVHFHGQRLTMDDSDLNALTGFGTHYRRFNGIDYRRQGLFSGLKK